MTAAAFLESLITVGISVSSERGKLIVDAPAGMLTEQLRTELAGRKAELLAVLEMKSPRPAEADRLNAQNEIVSLLSIAYRRHLQVQRAGGGRNDKSGDRCLASCGVFPQCDCFEVHSHDRREAAVPHED